MKICMRLLSYLSPFKWQIALAILLGTIMVASNIGLLSMAAYLIAAAALTPLMAALIIPIYFVRFMGVSRAVSRYAERLLSHHVTFKLLARLRTRVYSKLEPLAPAFLQKYRSGDMLVRLVSDVEELQNVYLRVLSPMIVAVLLAALTFGLFALFDPLLSWVALLFLVAAGIGLPLLAGRMARGLGQRQLALRGELQAQIVDGLQGVQDLLACGRASDQQGKIAHVNRELNRVQRRMAFITGLQQAMNDLLMNLGLWVVLLLAIPLVATHAITGVYLGFLTLLILASFEAVQPLAQAFQFLGHSVAAGKRIFKVIDAKPQVVEPVRPLPLPEGPSLEFDHVSFAYDPDESNVIDDVSISLQPGKRIALVGPSGAGKSTLAKLAVRFWDATGGTVRLDGRDIRDYRLEDVRALIGMVSQDTYLFNDTIKGNLLLARPEASDAELERVLEQVQLLDFVKKLPNGMKTWIGEQGLRLSGGERQRIAIARALLKDAPLLILDEASANLDPLTEWALLDTLATLMQGRTTLVITHRLVAMERMDEILVLNQGRIVERGTHAQLLANIQDTSGVHEMPGMYRQMFDAQEQVLILS